ncbi:MAG: TadE family protein, partial [Anaerolineales bacterium]
MAKMALPIGLLSRTRRKKPASLRARGQAMVEFLLVFPVLFILIMGAVEFSRLLAVYTVVNASSREAARYGAGVGDTGIGTKNRYQDCSGIIAAANRVSRSFTSLS